MADPFSVITGVLGILSSVIATSKAVTEIVSDVGEASKEIRCLMKDCHAFFSIVRSLDIALREQDVQEIVGSDAAILDMISNLADPLRNCRAVLTDLMVKMRKHAKSSEGKGSGIKFGSLKWAFFAKGEVKDIQLHLETTKSTLNSALDAMQLLLSLRSNGLLRTMGKSFSSLTIDNSSDYRQTTHYPPLPSQNRCIDTLGERPFQKEDDPCLPHVEHAIFQTEQNVLDSVRSLVHHTHRYIMSDDHLLCQQVARTYREFSEQLMQMQELKNTIVYAAQARCKYNQTHTAPDKSKDTGARDVGYHDAAAHGSSAAEIFLNCVSRFSLTNPCSSIDRLRSDFSGSPDYSLETSSSFYPEQYAVDSPGGLICVSAILPLPSHPRSQRFFLTFQEHARRWRRVIVVATFDNLRGSSAILQISSPADIHRGRHKILPKLMQTPLRKLLQNIENFSFVTNLSVNLREEANGQITADMTTMKISEDMLERHIFDEDKLLQDIKDLGCPRFKESQVVLRTWITGYRYRIWVEGEGRYCLERKVPFASAGMQGANVFDNFANEVTRLCSLRGCAGIIQFIGVVLDETGRHLRGYLCEAPIVTSLRVLFALANSLSKPIPWAIREAWIGQIVTTISKVHARGLIVGALDINRVNIRADGTAVLDLSDSAHTNLATTPDRLPPELRESMTLDTCRTANSTTLNFRTDIFQLGFAIWLIAEHRPDSWGYYCTRAACTSVPRYRCIADHVQPTELPPCSVGIPSYIDDIIRACRLPNPKDRPSALWLATLFPSLSAENRHPLVAEHLKNYSSMPPGALAIFCSECGDLTADLHYHCYICELDDFDLCPSCVAEGIHCWILQHELVKRIVKGGEVVDSC